MNGSNFKKLIMKKLIIFIMGLFIAGCATPGIGTEGFRQNLANKKNWPEETIKDFVSGKLGLGMTKEQIFWLCGSPITWSKYPTKDGIFETWTYWVPHGSISERVTTFDFKDGLLIGYSGNGKYFSDKHSEDLRNFEK